MSLGTKNRLQQVANDCREHLRQSFPDQRPLVEEFILEIEGPEHSADPARWDQFSDVKRSRAELLQRTSAAFEKWLNG